MFLNYKRLFKRTGFVLAGCALLILFCNYWIVTSTSLQIFNEVEKIPPRKIGLVLGSSKILVNGTDNLYFTYRIQAAYALYKSQKVRYLLLSGENPIKDYNEPEDMRAALITRGVPDSCIVLDYAGFRTLDSMVRCKEVFGEDSVTVISQEFHNQRAIFIANKKGINAIGFNARNVNKRYSFKTRVREYFARVKCVLDIYVLHTSPKFSGPMVSIE
ncbi:YdcF family protein [Hymenobacter sp. BT664]|uniref:YdcF family protein n=1 Tax=Hymenobacter montanus TaxID=2771359 RepID=A0A927GLE5_9BACT|nr:ElyC/SanA/YdcF family protein [Hymenobacter montanus]MBD2770517.1 YdcF family protein [Hymenobacter montanus]